jgi:hypothetical protein
MRMPVNLLARDHHFRAKGSVVGGRQVLGKNNVEIGDRVMDQEVKTLGGLQPLRDPPASPYCRSRGGFSMNIRL